MDTHNIMVNSTRSAVLVMQLLAGTTWAQNLVVDPGFEQNLACPAQVSDLTALPAWWAPNAATTDYYHTCSPAFGNHVPFNMAGKQWPHGGDAYAGIITQANDLHYAELVQGQLTEALKKGAYYKVAYYVSLAEVARIKDTRLGVCFCTDSTTTSTRPAPVCPTGYGIMQMTVPPINDLDNWYLVTGMYKAKGGERYITIGNFQGGTNRKDQKKNKSTTTKVKDVMGYYYIDDVVVMKARNRTDTTFTRWAATSQDEITAGEPLLLAPCSSIFQEGSSAFKDIKAIQAAAQQDTGSVPPAAMLEYLGDLLMRETDIIMEVAVHSAPMADSIAALELSEARAKAIVARFLESGVEKDNLIAVGRATPLGNGTSTASSDDDGRIDVRIVRVNKDPGSSAELAD